MASNENIILYEQGNQEPGKEAGDVIVQLHAKPHDIFQRHGGDLAMRCDIELSEALCGLKRVIKTIDSREIVVTSKPGEVIRVCTFS